MRKLILGAGLAIGMVAIIAIPASAFQFYTLDFEGFANGTTLTNQYASQHVTFDFLGAGFWRSSGIIGTPPAGIPPRSGVNTVSLAGWSRINFDVDVFHWEGYFTMQGFWNSYIGVAGYDAAGNAIGDNGLFGFGPTNRYLSLSSTTGIRSLLLFSEEPNTSPVQSWMDDMSYTTAGNAPGNPVPEPASLLLFGTGLVGAFAARKRLRK